MKQLGPPIASVESITSLGKVPLKMFCRDSTWFYLVDRKKDLIVASRYKVWPRDVEDVIYQHPAVKETAVVGVTDPYRGETVKAFVALKPGLENSVVPGDIIAFCKERMAAYKYPRQVEIVQEIPKTLTGKFLRRTLRDKDISKMQTSC